jgi:hypothetical protein
MLFLHPDPPPIIDVGQFWQLRVLATLLEFHSHLTFAMLDLDKLAWRISHQRLDHI